MFFSLSFFHFLSIYSKLFIRHYIRALWWIYWLQNNTQRLSYGSTLCEETDKTDSTFFSLLFHRECVVDDTKKIVDDSTTQQHLLIEKILSVKFGKKFFLFSLLWAEGKPNAVQKHVRVISFMLSFSPAHIQAQKRAFEDEKREWNVFKIETLVNDLLWLLMKFCGNDESA